MITETVMYSSFQVPSCPHCASFSHSCWLKVTCAFTSIDFSAILASRVFSVVLASRRATNASFAALRNPPVRKSLIPMFLLHRHDDVLHSVWWGLGWGHSC